MVQHLLYVLYAPCLCRYDALLSKCWAPAVLKLIANQGCTGGAALCITADGQTAHCVAGECKQLCTPSTCTAPCGTCDSNSDTCQMTAGACTDTASGEAGLCGGGTCKVGRRQLALL